MTTTGKVTCTVDITGQITWQCSVCGQPIAAGSGYLAVDHGAAYAQYRASTERGHQRWLEGTAVISLAAILAEPDAARWQALHRDCDPNLERDDYWFGVERADTLPKMLDWTAHLSGKVWLTETDWGDLIRQVAAAAGGADA